jgi:accessory gene regulator protein AgrB
MSDDPSGSVMRTLWRASLSLLGVTLVLWLTVQILIRIWLVLAIAAVVLLVIWLLARWWYFRS